MFSTKLSTRNLVMAGAITFLLGSQAVAQTAYPRSNNRGYANRVVEGTVASVVHDRNGDRVRLTNGMDLLVPASITGTTQGRRWGAATLEPGDVVRMNVYSREGDGRDARVKSLELLQRNSNSNYTTDRRLNGTVVSVDRRARTLVLQTDRGRTINVDFNAMSPRGYGNGNGNGNGNRSGIGGIRRGDHISISGRIDRGTVIADDILQDNAAYDQYGHRR